MVLILLLSICLLEYPDELLQQEILRTLSYHFVWNAVTYWGSLTAEVDSVSFLVNGRLYGCSTRDPPKNAGGLRSFSALRLTSLVL